MRITDVEVIVAGPVRNGPNWTIVKIVTDQPGLVGYGNGALSGGEMAVKAMIEEHLAPRLIGADPDKPHPAATALSNRALAAEGGFDYMAIPGTTHLLQLEEPAACADAALAFLSQIGFIPAI